jgi:iron complex outermembrane receptor protein
MKATKLSVAQCFRHAIAAALAIALLPLGGAFAQAQGDVRELTRMSLEELANLEVTSVSKTVQKLSSAPAAIYVVTREEILRSGARSIPEALRLAPNLQVLQFGSSSYGITARGFGDKRDVQTQSNKLLILIDGRTVYSPLFSGVFYDAQDVVMEDIERIEVISGPGATLWGANAMNGVINVITRSAASSRGLLAKAGSGNQESAVNVRYGDNIGNTAYRVYAKGFERGSNELADGASAHDRWSNVQGGFRADWRSDASTLTLQGDAYQINSSVPNLDSISGRGANTIARWERATERSHLSVQAYYDWTKREAPPDGASFELHTYDFEAQQSIALGAHHIVWGFGKRQNDYRVTSVGQLQFSPRSNSLSLTNIFAQDTFSLGAFELTAGLKLEDNPYSDWEALPDLRVSYLATEDIMLWAAASRGIRSPTPFDVGVLEFVGPDLFLRGNPDFRSEQVDAYQLGYRHQPNSAVSVSINAFYNDYDDLRSIELSPATFIPLYWGNGIVGSTYGVEAWANFQVMSWWRIAPGFRLLHKRLRFDEGASELLGVEQSGNDPRTQASLKSSIDIGHKVTFDAFLRYVNELPDPQLDEDFQLSVRVAWNLSTSLQLSLTGFNLLDEQHVEYPMGTYIPRSFFAEIRWQY